MDEGSVMFDPTTPVGFHTWLSIVALATGIVVTLDLLATRARPTLTAVFLATALLTNLTGFLLPAPGILPSHIVGALSMVAVLVAGAAQYRYGLVGPWRAAYAVSAVITTYLLAFVAVAQTFLKVPALHSADGGAQGPLFLVLQSAVLIAFVVLGILAVRARSSQLRVA